MTTSVNDRRLQYTATASQTIFVYDFPIASSSDLEVLQTVNATGVTNTLILTTDYTVSGVGNDAGGNVTLVTGAALNDIITITGKTPLSRTTDFNNAGDFLASEVNSQLDKITRILQENDTKADRSVKLKEEDTSAELEIPTATNRASKFLAFDGSGNAIAAAGTIGTSPIPVSAYMETLLDDENALEARTTLEAQEDVITTRGDLIKGSSTNAPERLAIGTTGKYLKTDGADPSWEDLPTASQIIPGIVELLTNAEQATGTDSTRAATAASILSLFGASTLATTGSVKIPVNVGGTFTAFVIKWGVGVSGTGNKTLTFAEAFPTACIYINMFNNAAAAYREFELLINGAASFDYEVLSFGSTDPRWIAIGY